MGLWDSKNVVPEATPNLVVRLVIAVVTVGAALTGSSACSWQNREGPDVTCADLHDGAENACQEGILATCSGARVAYRVCDDKDVCEASWQRQGAFACEQGEANGGTGGAGGGGSAQGGAGLGGSAGASSFCGLWADPAFIGGSQMDVCNQHLLTSCCAEAQACAADTGCCTCLQKGCVSGKNTAHDAVKTCVFNNSLCSTSFIRCAK